MDVYLFFHHHSIILCYDRGLVIHFTHSNDAIKPLLKRIIVADYKQLIETTHTSNLLCKVRATQLIHILSRLVKERNIQCRELFE